MRNPALLMARYARRPQLLTVDAAEEILAHIRAQDPRGLQSEGRLEAFFRRLRGDRPQPTAMEDAEMGSGAPAPKGPSCYSPLWAQQGYGDPEDEGFGWSLLNGAAMMSIDTALDAEGENFCGTWYHGYDTILAALRETQDDSRVGGRFIRVMSPGGVVAGGLAQLSDYIRENRAASGGKPIHFYCDMAASAAYWIAAQGDRIAAPRVGLVGSIGAVIVHQDWSEAYRKVGVKVEAIQFGAEKTAGAHWAPLSETARADLQAEIDQIGEDFVAAVSAGRPQLTAEILIGTQARVFMAHHDDSERSGQAIGFVDAIETEQEAFEVLLGVINGANTPPTAISKETSMASLKPKPKAETEGSETETGAEAPATTETEADDDAEDEPAAKEEPAQAPAATETGAAAAIAASKEAEAHPTTALAAIKAGLTLAQFKAMIPAAAAPAAPAPRSSALRDSMAGVSRVNADAAPKSASVNPLLADAKARSK